MVARNSDVKVSKKFGIDMFDTSKSIDTCSMKYYNSGNLK